jgi:superfamily II DNA or RNA helicase
MEKVLFEFDRNQSQESHQFTVRLSSWKKMDGGWTRTGGIKSRFLGDKELISASMAERALFKLALKSELEQRKIEGRFFSNAEAFTLLRIGSEYLADFVSNSQKSGLLVHGDGTNTAFEIKRNRIPEIKVNPDSFDLYIEGSHSEACLFIIRSMPVTYVFPKEIVQLHRGITYKFIRELPIRRRLPPAEFETQVFRLIQMPERVKVLSGKEIEIAERLEVIPVLNFEDKLKRAELIFLYNGVAVKDSQRRKAVCDKNEMFACHRDFRREKRCQEKLLKLGFFYRPADHYNWFLSIKPLEAVVSDLEASGFRLRFHNKPLGRLPPVRWRTKTDNRCIHIGGSIVGNGFESDAIDLLHAHRHGRSVIAQPDGSFSVIPNALKGLLGRLNALGRLSDKQIEFGRADFASLASYFEDQTLETDEAYADLCAFGKAFDAVDRYPLPDDLKHILRPYQILGYNWLRTLNDLDLNGILADDMGLGKTLQVLCLLSALKNKRILEGPSLLLVPKTLIHNWKIEIEKFTPDLTYHIHAGQHRKQDVALFKNRDIVITSYGLARTDVTQLRGLTWNYLILDEAHAIKNPSAQISKAVKTIPARRRLSLTGTPVENTPLDLWSQFDFLMPGFLFNLKRFKRRYVSQCSNLDELRLKTTPYILRRMKSQVLKELPPKTEITIRCEFKPGQKEAYQEALAAGRLEINGNEHLASLDLLTILLRLRQIACHPELVNKKPPKSQGSGKLDTVAHMAMEILSEGHRILIFSQFTGHLNIVKSVFDEERVPSFYLDGTTKNRAAVIDKFKAYEGACLFFISLKTGGTGLNLAEASYVFILDPWWNPAVENQAIDRCYRIGQKHPVTVYKFITKDSIEEKVDALKHLKKEMEGRIIDASDVDYAPKTPEKMRDLIGLT